MLSPTTRVTTFVELFWCHSVKLDRKISIIKFIVPNHLIFGGYKELRNMILSKPAEF